MHAETAKLQAKGDAWEESSKVGTLKTVTAKFWPLTPLMVFPLWFCRPEMHEETPLAKWQAENDAREEREGWPPRPGFVSSKEGAHEVV